MVNARHTRNLPGRKSDVQGERSGPRALLVMAFALATLDGGSLRKEPARILNKQKLVRTRGYFSPGPVFWQLPTTSRSYQVIVSDQICMLAPSRVSDHAACTTPSGPETS